MRSPRLLRAGGLPAPLRSEPRPSCCRVLGSRAFFPRFSPSSGQPGAKSLSGLRSLLWRLRNS